jgi:serine/threonine-protein kinase
VALKFMLPEAIRDEEQVERFEREARAAVQLKSDHAAKVSDVGKLKNGSPYMVMEYLEGRDLGAVLTEQRQLQIPFAVDLILQASEAIAEAHSLGIVHRDIKPKNLFLTRRVDGRPLLKVLDFGLAKTGIHGAPVGLTQTAAVFGSPQYMSPEQMRSARDVDARSDVWALGVCLYELVTGSVPFDSPTLPELCAMVLKDPPRPIEQLRADCPPDFAAVVMRCLEKEPARRYQDVAEFARALERFAAPHSHGSADRIFNVLSQSRANVTNSQSIEANAADPFDAMGGTKTAAVFDSVQERPRKGKGLWIGAGLAGVLVFAGVLALGIKIGTRRWAPVRLTASASPSGAASPTGASETSASAVALAPSAAPESTTASTASLPSPTASASATASHASVAGAAKPPPPSKAPPIRPVTPNKPAANTPTQPATAAPPPTAPTSTPPPTPTPTAQPTPPKKVEDRF